MFKSVSLTFFFLSTLDIFQSFLFRHFLETVLFDFQNIFLKYFSPVTYYIDWYILPDTIQCKNIFKNIFSRVENSIKYWSLTEQKKYQYIREKKIHINIFFFTHRILFFIQRFLHTVFFFLFCHASVYMEYSGILLQAKIRVFWDQVTRIGVHSGGIGWR